MHQLHLGAPVGLEICHVAGAGAVGLVVEIPARLRAGVLPAARRGLGGVHLGADQLAQMIELGHHQPTRTAELDVGHRVAIGGAQVKQHPGGVLGLDVGGDVLGDLDHAIGEATEDQDRMMILVLVAAIGRIEADHILAALDRLFPHLQLDVIDVIDVRVHRDHLEVEEVAVDLVAIAGEDRLIVEQRLDILADHRDLEEAVAGLDERFVRSGGLILLEQVLLGPGLGLLPAIPSQLLGRNPVLVKSLDLAQHLGLRPSRRRKTETGEARIAARYAIVVARPPADEERTLGQVVKPSPPARSPMVHPLGGRLANDETIRVVLRQAFFERLQAFDIAVTRNFSFVG